jgi:AraC-like DNA-binding protein
VLEPTVAAGVAGALIEFAVSKGASRRALAERSLIDPAACEDPDNRIPFAKYVALMRAGKEECHDPALALHFGEAFDCAEISIVGLIAGSCDTLGEAFAQFNRYARLAVEVELGAADRFQLDRQGGEFWMVDTRENPNDFPELTESTYARIVCTARRHFGRAQFIKAVHVTHPEPAYRDEYDRIFQMPVVFGSDRNAVLTDERWLSQKNAQSSRYVFGVLSVHAEALLKNLENSKSTRGHVESGLMPILHTGQASMDIIANKLGFSRQTLFRRLKSEGVTFEKILDELRHKLALHYLGREQGVGVRDGYV